LLIVVLLILLGDAANFLQTLRNMHEKTLILVIAVIPLDKGVGPSRQLHRLHP